MKDGQTSRYKNLRAEMAREGVNIKQISEFLGVRFATVSDKLNGRSRFFTDEAIKIKRSFFPSCSIEYLFDDEHHNTAWEPESAERAMIPHDTSDASNAGRTNALGYAGSGRSATGAAAT